MSDKMLTDAELSEVMARITGTLRAVKMKTDPLLWTGMKLGLISMIEHDFDAEKAMSPELLKKLHDITGPNLEE